MLETNEKKMAKEEQLFNILKDRDNMQLVIPVLSGTIHVLKHAGRLKGVDCYMHPMKQMMARMQGATDDDIERGGVTDHFAEIVIDLFVEICENNLPKEEVVFPTGVEGEALDAFVDAFVAIKKMFEENTTFTTVKEAREYGKTLTQEQVGKGFLAHRTLCTDTILAALGNPDVDRSMFAEFDAKIAKEEAEDGDFLEVMNGDVPDENISKVTFLMLASTMRKANATA